MGVPKDQIDVIARGAFLHDIGKMAIPDDILSKPGKLDPPESRPMREHCYDGYHMLQQDSLPQRSCRDRVIPIRSVTTAPAIPAG